MVWNLGAIILRLMAVIYGPSYCTGMRNHINTDKRKSRVHDSLQIYSNMYAIYSMCRTSTVAYTIITLLFITVTYKIMQCYCSLQKYWFWPSFTITHISNIHISMNWLQRDSLVLCTRRANIKITILHHAIPNQRSYDYSILHLSSPNAVILLMTERACEIELRHNLTKSKCIKIHQNI